MAASCDFLPSMKNLIFQALADAARNAEPVALGIISGARGSSPQKVGAKALFYADGRIKGTLGGGCLEAEAQRLALRSLRTGQPATFDLVLDHDFGWDDGLICGGAVEIFVEPRPELNAAIWKELSQPPRQNPPSPNASAISTPRPSNSNSPTTPPP